MSNLTSTFAEARASSDNRTEIGTDYSQQYFTPPQTQTQPPLKKKRNLSANPGFLFIICLIFKLVSIVYFWFWFWFVCCMCLSSLMFIFLGVVPDALFLVLKVFLSSFLISHHNTTNTFTSQSKGGDWEGLTSLTHSSMADSSPYTKPHFPLSDHSSRIQPKPTNQGKSCSGFILKALLLALFVVVLPLFPSQAPDFVSQTILNKFWELLHLLFIGIAVTYGLFSRRNSELDTTHTELETTHSSANDSTAAAPSYVSKVFPASSNIFYDNGCDNENGNSCEVDEKMVHCWNNQYFDGGPGGVCSNGGGTVGVFDEQYKTHLPISSQ